MNQHPPSNEWQALERLTCAAPDLLAACREALSVINAHTTEPIPVGEYGRLARILARAITRAEQGG